jgi:hypothetical protein
MGGKDVSRSWAGNPDNVATTNSLLPGIRRHAGFQPLIIMLLFAIHNARERSENLRRINGLTLYMSG